MNVKMFAKSDPPRIRPRKKRRLVAAIRFFSDFQFRKERYELSFVRSFVPSFVHLFVRSFVPSFVHLFVPGRTGT